MKVTEDSFTISGQLRDPNFGNIEIELAYQLPEGINIVRVRDMDTLIISDWTEVSVNGTFIYRNELFSTSEFINLN